MPNIPYNIRIQKQLREALQKIADEEGRTLANLIIRALWEWLKARKEKP